MMRGKTFLIAGMWVLVSLASCATSPPESMAAVDEKAVAGQAVDEKAVVDENTIVDEAEVTTVSREPAQDMCPAGTKEWCVRRFRTERCRCVRDSHGRGVMERLPNPDYQKRR